MQERSIYGRNRIRRGQIIINTGPIPKEPSRAERRHRVVKTVRIVAVEVIESSHLADKTPDELAEPLRAVRAGHISGRGSFLPFGTFHLSEDDDASLSHRRPGGSDHGDELVRAGIIAPTAGPINSSMAGASVAAPVDFGGSYWNPAIISGLPRNEFLLGSQLLIPSFHMASGIRAGAIDGIFPPTNRYGVARSDSGVASNLATGVSFRLSDDSKTTFGIGVFGLVGGGVNYAGSNTTPILTPRQAPNYFGVGPIYSSTSFLAILLTGSQQVTDRLAIGGGPMIVTGPAAFNPAFFAPGPRDALGLPTFPAATNARPFWGAGFQIGLLYNLSDNWNLGFSYKSPIWQERYGFNATTPDLAARRIGIQSQVPEILSWGIAYKGFERALIDVDLRYFDYKNTSLYGTKPIDGGLGWSSIFAVAVGGQYQATDKLTLRSGYLYNTNPIKGNGHAVQHPGPRLYDANAGTRCLVPAHRRHRFLGCLDPSVSQFDIGFGSPDPG